MFMSVGRDLTVWLSLKHMVQFPLEKNNYRITVDHFSVELQ